MFDLSQTRNISYTERVNRVTRSLIISFINVVTTLSILWSSPAVSDQCAPLQALVESSLASIPQQYQSRISDPRCQFVMQQIAEGATPFEEGTPIQSGREMSKAFTQIPTRRLRDTWKRISGWNGEVRMIDSGYSSGGFTVNQEGKPILVLDRVALEVTLAHEMAHFDHAMKIASFLQSSEGLSSHQALKFAAQYLMTPEGTLESEALAVRAELDYFVAEVEKTQSSPYLLVGSMNYPALQAMLRSAQLENLLKISGSSSKKKNQDAIHDAQILSRKLTDKLIEETREIRKILGLRTSIHSVQDFFPSVPIEYLRQVEGGDVVAKQIMKRVRSTQFLFPRFLE